MQPQFTLVASSADPHAALGGLPAKENPGSPAFADMLSGASVDKGTEPSFEKLGIAKSGADAPATPHPGLPAMETEFDDGEGARIRAGQGASDTEGEPSFLGVGLIGFPALGINRINPASPRMSEFAETVAQPSKTLPDSGKILPASGLSGVPLAGTEVAILAPEMNSEGLSTRLTALLDDANRSPAPGIAAGQAGATTAGDGAKALASNASPLGKISDIVGQAGACEVIVSFKPSNPTRSLRVAAAERALLDGKMDTSTLAALSTVTLDVKGVDTGKVGGAVVSGPAGTGPALVLPAGIGNAPPAAKLEAMLAGSDAPAKPTSAIVDGKKTSAGKDDADVRISARSVAEASQETFKHGDRTKQFDSALPDPRAADRLTPSQAGPGGPANGSGFPTSDLVAAPSTSRFFASSAPTGVELARQIAEVSQELAKSIDADGNTSGKLTLEHQLFGAVALRLTRDHHSGLEVRVDGSPELHAALATSLRNERGENRPQSHNHQHSQAGAEAGHMSGGHGGNTYGSGKENEPRFRLDGLRNDAGRQMPDNETEGRKDRHSPRSKGVFA